MASLKAWWHLAMHDNTQMVPHFAVEDIVMALV